MRNRIRSSKQIMKLFAKAKKTNNIEIYHDPNWVIINKDLAEKITFKRNKDVYDYLMRLVTREILSKVEEKIY